VAALMARIRTIKPEFPQSESMGRVSREARLLFVLLWTVCDDDGRTRAASRMLASLLYPYDDDAPKKIDGWLAELEREQCIERYLVEGSTYLQVCKWRNHQRIDHPTASKLPTPREGSRILASDSGSLAPDLDRNGKRIGKGSKVPSEPLSGDAPDGAAGNGHQAVERVFDHWRTTHNHPTAKLDAKRRKLIAQALGSYSEADLCQAITGYRNSPHHMGQNDRATVYDAIELLLRDAQHIDAGLRFARDPPRTDLSTLTRRNVAAVENWVPPELRAANAS
jgi:hypothetical protein